MRRPSGGREKGASTGPSVQSGQPSGQDADSKSALPRGILYIVATPIGHLRDVSLRALDVLSSAALVACEDTRITARLFARHGISTPLIAYHDHNAERVRPGLLARLGAGEEIALVSDAGSPLVSDPGYKLVREAVDRGFGVTVVPGPSAAIAALQLSGLPADRFFFAGFLPVKSAARRKTLAELKSVPGTLIFFETAPRLSRALADMADVLGDRPAAVARELTKMFEETRRDSLARLARHYAQAGPPKGEIVIVVAPPRARPVAEAADVDRILGSALARLTPSAAAAETARLTGLSRNEIYKRALKLRKGKAR